MKAEDMCALPHPRHQEMVERPRPGAAALEGADKVLRPEVDLVESDGMRHVLLLRTVDLRIHRHIRLRLELFEDIMTTLAGIKAKAARVPAKGNFAKKALPERHPVVDDAELARPVVEEAVEIARDDLVDVQEQRRT